MKSLENHSILVTGGTGSFGRKFCEVLLREYAPKRLIVFSRDELKQHDMRTDGFDASCMRYFIGDVRDTRRLRRAMEGVDIVVHAAALKHVPACEYNPLEAVQTNIGGAGNIIEAALDAGVKKVLALSTDKAVNPVNLYGATKLVAEKIFTQGNAYSGGASSRFSCVRYGNVVGSRGSVIPLFLKQRATGTITLTDERMTRFWITLDHAVRFVINCIDEMEGGEVFVPKIPSMKLTDLAQAIAPECKRKVVGIRPGEKLHEVLLSEDEGRHAVERKDSYVIFPETVSWSDKPRPQANVPNGFRYASDTNTEWLTLEQLKQMV
ncbi:MAG: UDP-N-acetylglucosamine 4,6-dehydratase (inverting) [Candidatus Peribacteraceae bacterium]|jgi:UDP-N-acetylglucosamine 4,6-dehydratase